MLSRQEELALIRQARRGDPSARDRLWIMFHDYAVAEARRLALQKATDPDEAEGEAALAILEAMDRFDLRCKVRFSTYLAQRLRGSVTELARRQQRGRVFDTARYQPGKPTPEHRPPKPPPSFFWSPKALVWAKTRVRRRNDRMIVKWLWFDAEPKSQAEIARKLQISRSAVCQRRRLLISRIRRLDPRAPFEQ